MDIKYQKDISGLNPSTLQSRRFVSAVITRWPYPAWACGQSCSSLGLWKGFSKATPVAKKSAVLRVTTVRSCSRAIAVKAQHLIAVDLKQMQQSLFQSFSRA